MCSDLSLFGSGPSTEDCAGSTKKQPLNQKIIQTHTSHSNFWALTRSVVEDSNNELSTMNTTMVLKSIDKLVDVRNKEADKKNS